MKGVDVPNELSCMLGLWTSFRVFSVVVPKCVSRLVAPGS